MHRYISLMPILGCYTILIIAIAAHLIH